ncbi:phenylacetyl-CoA ligase [Microdochium trichocladiopsis]|uniref:Phenylacetyl-CoA ligase n=1 Tax=Microdochium trichocladiopsis TaxID=1682393 RepID=A0A9P8YLK4_9PEZI|nr:phenylacetyl-CoA ligase [Microdochium trichocladiopsis]KAH7041244.1 phenylacetyl-CoA ligase [Microdochium trichocladiopsis]
MTLWKSVHPTLEIPTDITTWEWAFEHPAYSPVARAELQQQQQQQQGLGDQQHQAAGRSTLPSLGHYTDAFTKQTLDFGEVKSAAARLSTALARRYGLRAGETVSLFSTNSIWYPVAMWATVRVGGRVNGASPAYTADEMAHALAVAGTKVLITLPGATLDVALQAADQVGIPREKVLLLEGEQDGFVSVQSLIREVSCSSSSSSSSSPKARINEEKEEAEEEGPEAGMVDYYRIPQGKTNKQVCGFLNFSSGTTGLPKAVMLSHHNIIAQCHQLRQLQVLPVAEGGRYKILAVMPLFHITGLVRFCTYPVLMNGYSIMLPRFTMEAMLEAIVEYRVEDLILVPPIITRFVRDPLLDEDNLDDDDDKENNKKNRSDGKKYLSQIRSIVKRFSSGSAPVSDEVVQQLGRKFPGTGFRQGYGATESTACISAHPSTHFDYKYAATGGLLVANTEAKVVSLDDPPGVMLGPGQTGEICARGPQIAMGYLGNEAATRETFDDEGFLHTGDVGYIDDEGLIHIEDRIKEMIKVKGQQVAPAELEAVLLGHEGVEDVAVVGVPEDYSGERPKAFVVLKKRTGKVAVVGGKSKEEEEAMGRKLMDLVKNTKVKYKWLAEVEFVEELPKNPTGKLLRRVLKARERDVSRARGTRVFEEKPIRAKL